MAFKKAPWNGGSRFTLSQVCATVVMRRSITPLPPDVGQGRVLRIFPLAAVAGTMPFNLKLLFHDRSRIVNMIMKVLAALIAGIDRFGDRDSK